ncbi:NAD(P)H-quinone oxidoreductase [Actinacidiphila guanduensis]|uniref:NAD(P)H-quinone oxidoreductase n=1 Tax=Actinacidiphila guanduensis TaxID=310781 RepID=UPI000B884EF1|nr:NAD(P)H-quinone oxidoreductase [Actinacidiphila guanduensis]
MKAIVVPSPGPAEVMHWTSVDTPAPGPGELLVDVRASGVNNADILQRQGAYPVPTGDSPLLGLECAGVVRALGEGVDGWAVGDEVCALLNGGGYAEQVAVPAAQVLPKPATLTFEEAAALPEAACTVVSNVGMGAGLRAGETFLVHGGTSGIGTFAIQWAKAIGAGVLTTAGTHRKTDRARDLGADEAINYRQEDFVAAVLAATGGRGADVILDVVGAPYLDRNVHCLAPDGRLVIIGGSVSPASLDLAALMTRRGSVSATTLRARGSEQKARIVSTVRDEVWPLVEQGLIRPVIDTVVPVTEASRAHRVLEEGQAVGKVVLVI